MLDQIGSPLHGLHVIPSKTYGLTRHESKMIGEYGRGRCRGIQDNENEKRK